MQTLWRIELLGRWRVTRESQSITHFPTQKAASLLAYLAGHSSHPQPREALIEMLWPEIDPEAGRTSLRVALHALRRQLSSPGDPTGSLVLADRRTVRLDPHAFTTDVAEFEAAVQVPA